MERNFERKMAKAARLASAAHDAMMGAEAFARECGYSDEQVGALMNAFDAVGKAASRTRHAAEYVTVVE